MKIEREENIFYNLIKNETSLTEVFCNFMKYKIFRDLFIDIVNTKIKNQENRIDKSIVKFQNFETEVPLKENEEKSGRIDLQLKINENEKYLFEIKIEVLTKLTDNQPSGYLTYLKNDNFYKNENLFFILPRRYFHKNEILEKWEEETKYSKEEIENHNIIYWEDILKQLKKQELDKINTLINEFCEIIGYKWFYFTKVEFTKVELDLIFSDKKEKGYKMLENISIPVLMNKLFQIIDLTAEKFNYLSKEDRQNSNFYGYILNKNAHKMSKNINFDIWYGIDYEMWEQTKNPISIQLANINDIEHVELFIKNNQLNFKKFEYEDKSITFYISLEKEVFEQEDKNITEELTDKINEVIQLLKDYK